MVATDELLLPTGLPSVELGGTVDVVFTTSLEVVGANVNDTDDVRA